jgi:tetratricopeptide (TPR) repeat protein
MSAARRINTLWSLLRATSAEGGRARRRLAAGAALAMLMSGLLTALGQAMLVVAFCGLLLLVVAGSAAARGIPVYWPRLRARVRALVSTYRPRLRRRARVTVVALVPIVRAALGHARSALRSARSAGGAATTCLRVRVPPLAKAGSKRASRTGRRLAASAETLSGRLREEAERIQRERLAPPPQQIDLHREALRLNAAGTRHRRSGSHAEAVELHRRALEILRGLDDPRAVALTQNNLALALSHNGDDGQAIALFEEAAATLSELGEEEHEGRIMANLGLAHRRHGRHEQSENVLQLALSKLPPTSRAYETVEAELRRAS